MNLLWIGVCCSLLLDLAIVGAITTDEKRQLCENFVDYMNSTTPTYRGMRNMSVHNIIFNVTVENRASSIDLQSLRAGSACHSRTSCAQGTCARDPKILVCMLARDQATFINEHLAYHWVQGIDHFVIYDDNSLDNISDVLRPWVETGQVTLIKSLNKISESGGRHDEKRTSFQQHAYRHCFKNYAKNFTWAGFFDIDEFVTPLEPRCLPDILNDYRAFGGVSLNWQVYQGYDEFSMERPQPHTFRFEVTNYTRGHFASFVKPFCQVDRSEGPHFRNPHFVSELAIR
jgi:hypothetical protein